MVCDASSCNSQTWVLTLSNTVLPEFAPFMIEDFALRCYFCRCLRVLHVFRTVADSGQGFPDERTKQK